MSERGEQVEQGHAAYQRRAWPEAFSHLSTADHASALGPADLDVLATTAYLVGRDELADELVARAHHGWLEVDAPDRAARQACWLGLQLLLRGEGVRAGAWYARAAELVDGRDLPERGFLLVPEVLRAIDEREAAEALAISLEIVDLGDRFGELDLQAFGRLLRGQAFIAADRIAPGMESLDEAMVAVSADGVSPLATGIVYCAVIEACSAVFDLRRAREWTTALSHWCDAQPGLVPYRGQCLVHRAEIMQLQGSWPEAVDEARQACTLLDGRPAIGMAYYQLAELHRLRGEFVDSERCYREASRWIATPQPGLALLRLAQNRVEAAAAASRRAVADITEPVERGRPLPHPGPHHPELLSAHVEIMLADGDAVAARSSADELERISGLLDAPLVRALAESAAGACLVAEGDGNAALARLRNAWREWQQLDAPYESARVRVLTAKAHRLLGEPEPAEMELEAAGWVFQKVGAAPDLQRVREVSRRTTTRAEGPLTARETDVIRLVATGMTNRAIGNELFVSEKTVSRHLSNIFAKLGLASRAAATAYAYEHGLADGVDPEHE